MKRLNFYLLSVIFVISFLGCDNLSKSSTTQKTSRNFSLGDRSGLSLYSVKPEGEVLAEVGSWSIGIEDFDRQINAIIEANKGKKIVPIEALGILARTITPSYVEDIDLGTIEGKEIYLNLLVNLELFAQEAESIGLDEDPDVSRSIRRSIIEILDFSLLNDILKDIIVTPLEVENFYNDEYKKTLENIEQRKVREIVVRSEAKAKDILVEILRGASFKSLAINNSKSETADEGGDLGYLVYQPGVKFTKFWEAVLTLDQGQTSNIFKNPEKQEYYIIMVEDIKKGDPEPLNKIFDQLELILRQRKSFRAIDDLINSTRSRIDTVINSDLIN